MSKYCSECGTEISEGSKFCPNCGVASGASSSAGNQQTPAPMMGVKPKDLESKMMIAIKAIGATLALLFIIGLLIGGVEEDKPSSTPVPATTPTMKPTAAPVVATTPATKPTSPPPTPAPTPTSSPGKPIYVAALGLEDSGRLILYPNGDAVFRVLDEYYESNVLRLTYKNPSPNVYTIMHEGDVLTTRLYSDGTCLSDDSDGNYMGVWSYNEYEIMAWAGETAQTTAASTPTSITILDETTTVYSDEYLSYSNRLDGGTTITIGVWTDGNPVDLFLMDAQDFDEYESVQQTWEAETFSYYVAGSALHVVSKTYTWVVPESNTYYIVVDNTEAPDDGAYAGRAVNVHVVISE